jgi:hypothetical protein
MSKCSRCQKDFSPLIKNNGLLYKTCDRCRYTDDKYRDKHKEQIKEYREANKEQRKEYDIYYYLDPRSHPLERRPAALAARPRGPGG